MYATFVDEIPVKEGETRAEEDDGADQQEQEEEEEMWTHKCQLFKMDSLKQGCGSAFISSGSGSGSSTLGWIPIRIQGFNDQIYIRRKKLQLKNKNLDQKLQFTYPYASMKNVQVTEEAFSSQKRPSNTSKHEIF
jgi:hypothetical protein